MNPAEPDLTTLQLPRARPPGRPRPPATTLVALVIGAILLGALGYRLLATDSGSVRTEELGAGTAATTTAPTTAAPSTTAAPEPAAPTTLPRASATTAPRATTATTRPARLTSDSRLSLDGIGPVDIGMTLEEASAAAGVRLRLFDQPPGPECRYAGPDQGSGLGDELAFMVVNGRIARVDVGIMGPDRIRTVSGIGKGSTEADVMAAYPGRIRVERHPYIAEGRYLVYVPNDPAYRHLSMIFETVNGEVRSFRAGLAEQVSWTEGCS